MNRSRMATIGREEFSVLRWGEEIAHDVDQIAGTLRGIARGRSPVFIGILKGSFVFLADLVRAFDEEHEIEFLSLSRYNSARKDASAVRVLHDLTQNIGGRLVFVVEGIRSSNGTKIEYIDRFLRLHKPEEIIYVALARQRSSAAGPIPVDAWGFEIEDDEYVVGYGLDLDERYRSLPFVGIRLGNDVAGRTG